jgi:hypothetical protein
LCGGIRFDLRKENCGNSLILIYRVTTTNGTVNAIVWAVNSGNGDQRLRGFNGDTGAVVYTSGGSNELMNGTSKWNIGIVARGRVYFAGTNKVCAFTLP